MMAQEDEHEVSQVFYTREKYSEHLSVVTQSEIS